jgi:hypothetical protein
MKCDRCSKPVEEDSIFHHEGKKLCEDCRLHVGIFPLGHIGHLKKSFYIKDRKR